MKINSSTIKKSKLNITGVRRCEDSDRLPFTINDFIYVTPCRVFYGSYTQYLLRGIQITLQAVFNGKVFTAHDDVINADSPKHCTHGSTATIKRAIERISIEILKTEELCRK